MTDFIGNIKNNFVFNVKEMNEMSCTLFKKNVPH